MQDRSARRIHGVMRAVSVLGILVVVTGLGLFMFGYLIPYFHSEFSVGEEEPGVSENSMSSGWESSIPLYNSMGLPVYEDEISLFVINSEKPVGADYRFRYRKKLRMLSAFWSARQSPTGWL